MRLVPTREALQLTGLSAPTLREWTSRRALIPADAPPRNQGSSAQYSWQTILLLRLAVSLRDQFHLELQAHRSLFASLRQGLRGGSFIALWDKVLALLGNDEWLLLDEDRAEPWRQDAIVILLNPHLIVLSERFSLPTRASSTGQFDLFPATPVGASRRTPAPRAHDTSANAERRRRLA